MSIRLFGTLLILLLIPVSLACSIFTSTPVPSQADIEKEEQAVYVVFVGESKSPALILQDTSTGLLEEDPQQLIDNLKGGLTGISNSTIDSYVERNAQPSQLAPDMQLGEEHILLGSEELAKITRQPNWHEILKEKYPSSHGYFIFSRVGFNQSLDQAVIYVGQVAGPLMGAGYYYLLEKQAGTWTIKEQIMVWIS